MKKLVYNYHFWIIGILGMALQSCSTKFKTVEHENSKKIFNIKYGPEKQQRMDVFLPKNYDAETPIVMIVHGGAWKFGRKEHMKMIQEFLFKENIPSININYRLLKKGILYTDQVSDISDAIKKSNELAESWNLKPSNFVLLGESAGGHLAMLYGYKNPEHIKKLISMSGPTDFYSENYLKSKYGKRTKGIIQKVVGDRFQNNLESFKNASPIANVSSIPTLIFQGDRDFLVNKSQGLALDSVLTAQKIPHRLVYMKKSGHVPRFVKWKRDSIIFPNILSFIKEDF